MCNVSNFEHNAARPTGRRRMCAALAQCSGQSPVSVSKINASKGALTSFPFDTKDIT